MIKVLVVDDSVAIRQVLKGIINNDRELTVVGEASDPFEAREKIKKLNPDVITLDVEMPKMDGITFLKNLMRLRPMPVVMISTLTQTGAPVTLDALEIGAVDYIPKPSASGAALAEVSEQICEKLKIAARATVRAFDRDSFVQKSAIKPLVKALGDGKGKGIVAIGASTGGTEAIKEVLTRLPENMLPVVITQHIPAAFSDSYAKRLDRSCALNVVQAESGMKLQSGYAYLAPGDRHLVFKKSASGFSCILSDEEPVNRHKPSVEVMFDSLRESFSGKIFSVMLTGMGNDGATAMRRLRDAGHHCIIQDEASSVVWGMPKAAYDLGASDSTFALSKIPATLIELIEAS